MNYYPINQVARPSFHDIRITEQLTERADYRVQERQIVSRQDWLDSLGGDYSLTNNIVWQSGIVVVNLEPVEDLTEDYGFIDNAIMSIVMVMITVASMILIS